MNEASPVTGCRVSAPARLHLGFLDLNGGLGRRYGSIGLALDQPSTDVIVARAQTTSVAGAERERVLALVERTTAALALKGRYRVEVTRAIPAHAGLGSGTQLALAIGLALMRLEGLALTPQQIGDLGATGIGQTSWGPTGFAFVRSPDVADRLYHSLVEDAKARGLEIAVVRGRNAGATIATF
jgi:beta-ribofuranosylaminobenzene 5'-phosphate synthase